MSIKENVDYVKTELSSEEKFLENFVRSERFFKKYKTLILSFIIIVIVGFIGVFIKTKIDESNKFEANLAFNKVLENNNDAKALADLKAKNKDLYEIALYLQAKKEAKIIETNVPLLKELSKYEVISLFVSVPPVNEIKIHSLFNKYFFFVSKYLSGTYSNF